MNHYIFIISQLWLTSHPRSIVVLLDTGTPVTSREIYSEDAIYNDAIHHLDKLNFFPALAFELFSSVARALGFITEGFRVHVPSSEVRNVCHPMLVR